MMKVVMMNYDFKVFWKGRLVFLHDFLGTNNISFHAIELFGKGSPYSFDSSYDKQDDWWTCLFPGNSADEVSKDVMKKSLFEKLNQINPDIIIASSIVFFAGALGMRWAKKNKKKFIMFENAKPSQFKRNPFVQKIKDTLIAQSDGLWLPSNDYDKEYQEFIHNTHFFYGYCCVDNKLFKRTEKNNFDHNKILCIARLVPIKNIDNLLRSWQIVEKSTKVTYKLQIIGDGPEHDTLTALMSQLDLQHVEFLGGIDNQYIPPYFYDSDGFVLTSFSETWGLVVNEAMAAGLPILLSNKINAAHTLLKENINGFGFDPLNINEIAAAILKLIDLNSDAKQAMSAKSLATIDEMDYENMGLRLIDALFKIKEQPIKSCNVIDHLLINFWDGRYSTFAWNRL